MDPWGRDNARPRNRMSTAVPGHHQLPRCWGMHCSNSLLRKRLMTMSDCNRRPVVVAVDDDVRGWGIRIEIIVIVAIVDGFCIVHILRPIFAIVVFVIFSGNGDIGVRDGGEQFHQKVPQFNHPFARIHAKRGTLA